VLFVGVSLLGFAIWFVGETVLFAPLFSYFHRHTGFRELLPANAAFYFLQVTNLAVASSALLLFLKRHKGVAWSAGGMTLLLHGLLDAILLAAMSLAAIVLGLKSPLRIAAPYAAVVLAAGLAIAGFFLCWRPDAGVARWLYERPALGSFRAARLEHYAKLAALRLPIFAAEGLILYGQLHAFHVHRSMLQTVLFSPVALLIGSLPLAPVGLGTLQLVFVKGLAGCAMRSDLLAAALAISGVKLVWRAALGMTTLGYTRDLWSGGAREAIEESAQARGGSIA